MMDELSPTPKSAHGAKRHSSINCNHGRRPSIDKMNNPGIIYEVGQEVWYEDGVDEWTEAIIIELHSKEVALEFVDSDRKLYGVSLSCIAPIEFETDDELFNLLSEFELEDHYDSVLSITAGVSTLEALIDVRVKDLQWSLKAPAEEVHKLLAAAKQQVSTLNADEHAAKEVEEAAIRGNLGLKI